MDDDEIAEGQLITLYACGTPNVLKVMLLLEESGLAYRLDKINVHAGEQFKPEFLALNPNNKLPVIVDPDGPDGRPITVFESGAILIYLAEKTGRFLPTDLRGRTEALQWLMLQMSGVGPMFGQAVHFHFMAPAGNEYARARDLTETRRLYDVIERRVTASPWLGGGEYGIADIATLPWIANFHRYAWAGIDLSAYPALARWIETIQARPAYRTAYPIFRTLAKESLAAQQNGDPDQIDRFFGRGVHSRA